MRITTRTHFWCKNCGYGPFASLAGLENHSRTCKRKRPKGKK